jgi:adenine-specific DNA-methyltransferase
MPILNWIGKDKVINHHLDVPFHTLNEEYTFKNGELKAPSPFGEGVGGEAENKIINADNLLALKSLLPQYEGRIKCIYIDPPYNTGNEGWVYNDNVNDPKFKKWLKAVVGKEGEDLTRHDKWLCMMYPRLKLLHKLLANDGAIFISIDDNEQANLKLMMDEIFGAGNFVSNIIWQKKTGASDAIAIANITEYIYCYVKNNNFISSVFEKNKASYDLKRYKYSDENVQERGPYYIDNLDRGGLQYSDSLNFGIECPDGTITFPNGRKEFINDGWIWKWSKTKIEWAIKKGFIEFRNSKSKESGWSVWYKNYLLVDNKNNQIERAAPIKNLINDVLNANAASEIKSLFESTVFKYSKPSNLITRLLGFIKYDKNSIILDSFAGSGTTAHAVLNLNKQDGGNRKFILVEMEDYAESITAERVKRVINGYNDKEGTGGGFIYYTMGQRVLDEEDNLNPNLALHKIHQYIWYAETRTPFLANATAAGYLGKHNYTGIYFNYKPNEVTVLDDAYLVNITQPCEQYIVYADMCLLPEKLMEKNNIIFKKIPRDISKL